MEAPNKPKFSGGRNMAMKVPPHQYDNTVKFYREVLSLPVLEEREDSTSFQFGQQQLWIDRVVTCSQAEIWLEVVTNDLEAASSVLSDADVVRCDEIESLPDGFKAFWISSPASVIHLVCDETESM